MSETVEKYDRIKWNRPFTSTSRPRSKEWSVRPFTSLFCSLSHRLLLPQVPKLLGVGRSHGEAIALEDADVHHAGRRDTTTLDEASLCLQWLARFHRTFLHRSVAGDCEERSLWSTGCYWHLDTRQEELQRMEDSDELKERAAELDARLEGAQHKTIVHGDAKVANFCFGERSVVAVDFQYCGQGIGVRDVAYFLGSVFNDTQLERHADALLTHYFSHLQCGEEVEREWRLLYPVCWADFERFLRGWSPGHWKSGRFAAQMVKSALATKSPS